MTEKDERIFSSTKYPQQIMSGGWVNILIWIWRETVPIRLNESLRIDYRKRSKNWERSVVLDSVYLLRRSLVESEAPTTLAKSFANYSPPSRAPRGGESFAVLPSTLLPTFVLLLLKTLLPNQESTFLKQQEFIPSLRVGRAGPPPDRIQGSGWKL